MIRLAQTALEPGTGVRFRRDIRSRVHSVLQTPFRKSLVPVIEELRTSCTEGASARGRKLKGGGLLLYALPIDVAPAYLSYNLAGLTEPMRRRQPR
jgi:hypothetical protein